MSPDDVQNVKAAGDVCEHPESLSGEECALLPRSSLCCRELDPRWNNLLFSLEVSGLAVT